MVNKTKNQNVEPHDLWLASLGVVSLTRKQAVKAYAVLVKEGAQFRTDASKRIDTLTNQARDRFGEVKTKVEAKVEPVLARANDAYGTVKHEVEVRLAPVVDLFGADKKVVKKVKPAARKRPTAKKVANVSKKKTTVTKAAKKTAPRSSAKKAA